MHFYRFVSLFAGACLIFFCSCEKHRVGEMPEEQKEHVELAKKGEGRAGSGESKAPHGSPTPAEFFPEKKNP